MLERLLARVDARDADGVRACLQPDVDFRAPGVSGGADAALAWMSPLMMAASHLHHQVVSVVFGGDSAAAELAISVSFGPADGRETSCCAPATSSAHRVAVCRSNTSTTTRWSSRRLLPGPSGGGADHFVLPGSES